MTALIFSYFLPDPSLVELAKRFETDSSRCPALSFITVGQDTTFSFPDTIKMYFFSSRYSESKNPQICEELFGFHLVFTVLFSLLLRRGAWHHDTLDRDPSHSWQDWTLISVVTVSLRKPLGNVCVQTGT